MNARTTLQINHDHVNAPAKLPAHLPSTIRLTSLRAVTLQSAAAHFKRLSVACCFGLITLCLASWVSESPLYASPKTDDLNALNSIRKIYRAEIEYESTYPANGFACSLAALGGDPKSGSAGPKAAQLIDNDLASGIDHGYTFKITECETQTVNGVEKATSFKLIAVPQTPAKTGQRGFCSNQSGELTADPEGGANCTTTLIK